MCTRRSLRFFQRLRTRLACTHSGNPPSELKSGYGPACSCKLLFMVNIHHRSAGRCSHTRTRQFRSSPGSPQNLVHHRMETRRWTHAVTQIPTDLQQKKMLARELVGTPYMSPNSSPLVQKSQLNFYPFSSTIAANTGKYMVTSMPTILQVIKE